MVYGRKIGEEFLVSAYQVWVEELYELHFCKRPWRRSVFLPEKPRAQRAWRATACGVAAASRLDRSSRGTMGTWC